MNQTDKVLMRPIFLSTLPVEQFRSLPRKYLFSEIARLDRLLDMYPVLVAEQTEISLVNSLQYCHNVSLARYDALRKLV
jgi:hypothetical protein